MPEIFQVVSRDDGATLNLRHYNSDYLRAELRGLGLNAEVLVGTYLFDGFGDFFTQMATNWRGWHGAKTWSSLEDELQISAEADKAGHIGLSVELRHGAPAVWIVTLGLVVEAGQLERLARDAHAFEVSLRNAA